MSDQDIGVWKSSDEKIFETFQNGVVIEFEKYEDGTITVRIDGYTVETSYMKPEQSAAFKAWVSKDPFKE